MGLGKTKELEGREQFFVIDTNGIGYVVTTQNIASLSTSYADILDIPTVETGTTLTLRPDGSQGVVWAANSTDGKGTTANGTAIDLGGILSSNAVLDNLGLHAFRIENSVNSNIIHLNHNATSIVYNSGDITHTVTIDYDNFTINMLDAVNDYQVFNNTHVTASKAFTGMEASTSTGVVSLELDTTLGMIFSDTVGAGLFMADLPTGATAGGAGAATNQLWVTASHATLPDGVVMRG